MLNVNSGATFNGYLLNNGSTSIANINSGGVAHSAFMDIGSGGQINFLSGSSSTIGSRLYVLQGMATSSGNALSIASGGSILVGDRLVVDYSGVSPLSTISGDLSTGRAGGAWNGNGINSSAVASDPSHKALGIAEASAVLGASGGVFYGQSADATAVLVKFTYLGDANLDGVVNIADLGAVATHYGQSIQSWTSGDFNYDGTVNIADLGALATNYG